MAVLICYRKYADLLVQAPGVIFYLIEYLAENKQSQHPALYTNRSNRNYSDVLNNSIAIAYPYLPKQLSMLYLYH